MGFRFRRTLKILPGLHLNISKSGISASIGPRGLHYTIGAKGTRTTVGLPGSGLSYTEYRRYPQTSDSDSHPFRTFMLWLAVLAIGFAIVLAVLAPAHAESIKDCKTDVFLSLAAICRSLQRRGREFRIHGRPGHPGHCSRRGRC
jgi:Protein of unknown function (DUF4236)